MAEPISDERLRQVRALVDFPSDHPVNCHPVNLADVAGLIARLDAAEAGRPDRVIDIVFDGPPGPVAGRFVEVEDSDRCGIGDVGEWIERDDGFWALRLRVAEEESNG